MGNDKDKKFHSNSNMKDLDAKTDSINSDDRSNPKKKDYKRNKDSKISKDKKKNPRDGEVSRSDPKSKSTGNPFYTLNGRNGIIVDILNLKDVDFSVLDVDLDLSEVLKQPSTAVPFLSSEFCNSLDTIVKTYSTSRGYVTSVTGKIVANVLRLSMRAFATLSAIWRTQASYNLKAQNGFNVGPMFYRKSVQSVNSSLALCLADPIPSPIMIDESANISNAIWMRDYVSYLNKMYLPKILVDMLSYLYRNAFTAEAGKGLGTSSLILLWPISGNTSLVSSYATTVAALESQFATYPDLELMLKVCGFDNKSAIEVDFTRPLAANVLNIVYDPIIPRFLENLGPLDCGYMSYTSDLYCTYQEYDDIGSIFGFKDIKTIDTSQNILYWLINFNALSNLGISQYPGTGDLCQLNGGMKMLVGSYIEEAIYIPENIHCYFDGWSSLQSGYLAQLVNIMYNVAVAQTYRHGISGLNSRRSLLVKISVSVDPQDNELSFQISPDKSTVLDGANNYTYDENEAAVIMTNMLPTLIYGAEWRSKLQMVYENIANSVSGIKY